MDVTECPIRFNIDRVNIGSINIGRFNIGTVNNCSSLARLHCLEGELPKSVDTVVPSRDEQWSYGDWSYGDWSYRQDTPSEYEDWIYQQDWGPEWMEYPSGQDNTTSNSAGYGGLETFSRTKRPDDQRANIGTSSWGGNKGRGYSHTAYRKGHGASKGGKARTSGREQGQDNGTQANSEQESRGWGMTTYGGTSRGSRW